MDAHETTARPRANLWTTRTGFARLAHLLLLPALLAGCLSALAQETHTVTLAWDRNSETNLANYILKYGGISGSYTDQVTVAASATSATVSNLGSHRTYYFVVTARNDQGVESDPSSEVMDYVPRLGPNSMPIALAATATTSEDTARNIVLTASDADDDPLTYSVQVPPANGALSGTPPNLTYTPRANFTGTDNFTFRASDGLTNSATATVSITVVAVNDRPTLNSLSQLSLPTNAGPQTIQLSGIGSGAANEAQPLSVTATSSNPSLVPHPTVNYSSPNATGSLSFTPARGTNGVAAITVTVRDGQSQNNSFSRTFSVVLGSAPPVKLFVEAESGTPATPMQTGTDPAASNGQFVYSRTAGSGRLDLQLNLPLTDDYVVWCRTLSPDGGTDSFFVSVDGGTSDIYDTASGTWSPDWEWTRLNGRTAGGPRMLSLTAGEHTLTFLTREASTKLDSVYITNDPEFVPGPPPNVPPTLDPIANLALPVSSAPHTIRLTGISVGGYWEDQTLRLQAVSSNPALIPNPTITFDPLFDYASLVLQPVADASGKARITVTVNDGATRSNTVSRTFQVQVGTPVYTTLFVEAEAGYVTPPMVLSANSEASGSTYIASSTPSAGSAAYVLQIPETDTYTVWCRVVSSNSAADSFFVSVDSGPEDIFDAGLDGYAQSWKWTLLNGRGAGTPRSLALNSGTHILRFRAREVGSALDAIYVTNDPNFVPVKLAVTPVSTPVAGKQLSFQSPAGYRYRLQATEDLKTWTTIWESTVAGANQRFSFVDSTAPASGKRFYRLIGP